MVDNYSFSALVSVIISVYNCGEVIDECIDSILAQSYTKWECIICDDFSTYDTYDVIRRYQTDNRFTILRNEKNMGQSMSRNRCLEYCKGEYVLFQDADDVSEKDRMQRLLYSFEEEIGFVGSGFYEFDKRGIFCIHHPIYQYPSKYNLLLDISFCHASIMIRTDVMKCVGGYRVSKHTRRGEDYDLILRLYAEGYKGKNIDNILYGYRVDSSAYARRTFKSRIDECVIRYQGFKANKMILPIGWIFVLKPIPAFFVHLVRGMKRGLKIHLGINSLEKDG